VAIPLSLSLLGVRIIFCIRKDQPFLTNYCWTPGVFPKGAARSHFALGFSSSHASLLDWRWAEAGPRWRQVRLSFACPVVTKTVRLIFTQGVPATCHWTQCQRQGRSKKHGSSKVGGSGELRVSVIIGQSFARSDSIRRAAPSQRAGAVL